MPKSPRKVEEKQRRALRRRNHVALDLWDAKYRKRIHEVKTKKDKNWKKEIQEDGYFESD